MMEQNIGCKLGSRNLGVTEVNQYQGNSGGSCGSGIGPRIANHDRAGQIAAHSFHGIDQVRGVGLGRGDSVNAHHIIKKTGHAKLGQ